MEKTLENALDCKEIKPVNPKGNQSWIFIGRTDAQAEAVMLWPPDVKSQLTGKDSDAGKNWRQEDKRVTEDEMVGWHHWFDGGEFEQIQGNSEGQGNLACCSPWGCKESDTTEWLNNKSFPLISFQRFGHLPPPGIEMEKILQMQSSLTKVNVSHKWITFF